MGVADQGSSESRVGAGARLEPGCRGSQLLRGLVGATRVELPTATHPPPPHQPNTTNEHKNQVLRDLGIARPTSGIRNPSLPIAVCRPLSGTCARPGERGPPRGDGRSRPPEPAQGVAAPSPTMPGPESPLQGSELRPPDIACPPRRTTIAAGQRRRRSSRRASNSQSSCEQRQGSAWSTTALTVRASSLKTPEGCSGWNARTSTAM